MTAHVHVESLLHLSALSLVVSIAYLGLDKVHLEKNEFVDALIKARAKAGDLVKRCELQPGSAPPADAIFYRFPWKVRLQFYALAHVADARIPMGPMDRFCHCLHRSTCVPFLRYFAGGADRKWVSSLAALSLAIFLYLTAAALWEFNTFFLDGCLWLWVVCPTLSWIELERVTGAFYGTCAIILIWVFVTVGVTRVLKNLARICDDLQAAVDQHMRKMVSDATRYALQDPAPVAPAPVPAAPPPDPPTNGS